MWSPNSPARPTPVDGTKIKPIEVLYYYDGPTIFTATLGLSEVLFSKFDETEDTELFVVSPIKAGAVAALREGRLSVRGALEGESYWVVQTTGELHVVKSWSVSEYELPTRILPARNHGLLHQLNPVPDTLEQATGFFSVKYNGPALSRQSISFRRLKSLIGEVYDVANNYLIPVISQVSKYSITDFELAPIKLASLLISIKRPIVLQDAIARRKLQIAPAEGILGQIQQQRDDLMTGMSEVVNEASRREISMSFAGDHVTWIAALNTLTPPRGDDINVVEVATSDSHASRMIVIDADTATRIKAAHSEVARFKVTLRGKVVEVNAAASTFVFRADNIRQTTCTLDLERFHNLVSGGELVVNAQVEVTGMFERRERRDLLHVEQINIAPR